MKIYIAIPITGHEDLNRPLADAIALELKRAGHEPVIPHLIDAAEHPGRPCPGADTYPGVTGNDHAGLCYLKENMRELLLCDRVVAAPGWLASRGSQAEIALAHSVEIPVSFAHKFSDRIEFHGYPMLQDRPPAFS